MAKLPQSLTIQERREIEKAYVILRSHMPMGKTPQGDNYWKEVIRNLYGLMHYSCYPYDEELGMAGQPTEELQPEPEEP